MTRLVPLLRCLVALACLAVTPWSRAGWVSQGKVNAIPPLLNEKFGISVAIDGDWMAVGASESTVGIARSTGSVHMFKNDNGTWVYRQTLFTPRPLVFQVFGCSVALRGNTLAVGSWGSNSFAGRAYVFTRSASDIWEQTAVLEASDPQPSRPALFGWSISMDTPVDAPAVIAVGRPNDGATSTGAVYVFESVAGSWSQVAKLVAPAAAVSEQVGQNVSIRDGVIISGSSRYRRASVFKRNSGVWAFDTSLSSPTTVIGDGFGASAASGGSFVVVGSPNRSRDGLSKAGVATVFHRRADGTWTSGVEIGLESPRSGDNFGYSLVAVPVGPGGAPMIAVGIPGYDVPNPDSGIGAVFQYSSSQWQRSTTDLWSLSTPRGQFAGKAIAVSANGLAAAISSELPRGSTGGAFPMAWQSGNTGDSATRDDSTTNPDSGSGGSGGSGGSSGSGSSGENSDPLAGGSTSDPSSNIGSGGRPRAPRQLPPLTASFGAVTDTVVVDAGIQQTVIGVQTDGVQEGSFPQVQVLATYPASWTLAGMGDVNGDASGDLIWRDGAGKIVTWLRDGTNYLAKNELRALTASESIVASLDFDGDGVQDIITRDADDNEVHVLRMRNGQIAGEFAFALPGAGWNVVPHAMISGMYIRHAASGEVRRVQQNLLSGDIEQTSAPSPAPTAVIEGLGDIDGNGTDDLVTRDPSNDEVSIWRMDGRGRLVDARELGIDGGRWKIEAVRDWDNNGSDDLLVTEGGSGRLIVLYMHFEDGVCKILKSRVIGSVGGARVVDVTQR